MNELLYIDANDHEIGNHSYSHPNFKKITLEEAKDLIKKKSRNYAKRQYTWFKHQMNVKWFDININKFDETINEVIDYIENN